MKILECQLHNGYMICVKGDDLNENLDCNQRGSQWLLRQLQGHVRMLYRVSCGREVSQWTVLECT